MKKLIFASLMLLYAVPVLAKHSGGFENLKSNSNEPSMQANAVHGGFSGPSVGVVTVEQAKKMHDDTWVTLRGYIDRHVGGDKYLFRDDTGSINVEIDHKYWNGQVVTPQDKVEIQGEVDQNWNSIEIDVKRINKV